MRNYPCMTDALFLKVSAYNNIHNSCSMRYRSSVRSRSMDIGLVLNFLLFFYVFFGFFFSFAVFKSITGPKKKKKGQY